ncbi:hypothetical protein ES703_91272 [subsurface metagenome]
MRSGIKKRNIRNENSKSKVEIIKSVKERIKVRTKIILF